MRILVIADGASEPVRDGEPTSLERARTPGIDRVARAGRVSRVATTPTGARAGSEVGVPVLLGAEPRAEVSRGLLEAAAADVEVPEGSRAWRMDLYEADGSRVPAATARAALAGLRERLPNHAVAHLRGHRLLAVGEVEPKATAEGLDLDFEPFEGAGLTAAAGELDPEQSRLSLAVWGDGEPLRGPDLSDTVVITGPGAALGIARSLGARAVVPEGATGDPATDLMAKRDAALRAIAGGATRVVVHVGAPDEAAHACDPNGKVAAIEALDAALVAPLHAEAARRLGVIAVCPDHGTDPRDGRHDGAPVPCAFAGRGIVRDAERRMTERRAARRPLVASPWVSAGGATDRDRERERAREDDDAAVLARAAGAPA